MSALAGLRPIVGGMSTPAARAALIADGVRARRAAADDRDARVLHVQFLVASARDNCGACEDCLAVAGGEQAFAAAKRKRRSHAEAVKAAAAHKKEMAAKKAAKHKAVLQRQAKHKADTAARKAARAKAEAEKKKQAAAKAAAKKQAAGQKKGGSHVGKATANPNGPAAKATPSGTRTGDRGGQHRAPDGEWD